MNGDISLRDFVAGLAKSDLYKQNYFFRVSPIRGIELNYKHLLGRPPINQAEVSAAITLIAEHGFDGLVEKLTRSGEYLTCAPGPPQQVLTALRSSILDASRLGMPLQTRRLKVAANW
jgi:hypothetical protein